MKYKQIVLVLSLLAFGFSGCVSDVEEEIIPQNMNPGSGSGSGSGCDTDGVTFSVDVLPLIQSNCYQCHDAATSTAGVNLEGYERIKASALSGKLIGVIDHQTGFSPMPKNRAKLLTCDIESIKKWIEDGTPEN